MIRARSGYRSQCAENWQNMLSGLHVFSKRSFLRKRPPPKTMFCKSFAHDDCQPKLHWSPAFYEACIGRVGCSWSLRIGRPNSDPSVIFSLKYSEMWNSSPWSKEYYILYILYYFCSYFIVIVCCRSPASSDSYSYPDAYSYSRATSSYCYLSS